MDNDFKTIYDNLRAEQEALNAKMQSAGATPSSMFRK